MKLLVIFVLSTALLFVSQIKCDPSSQSTFNGDIWAVLVAGSNGYGNYRHQADVCHAYHTLHSHGIPDERIIVMMYDDIAFNKNNPTPGVIINHPEGKNVYEGVPKHYTGKEVTPENFLAVLMGDQKLVDQGKKVLNSTHNDHVFVFFTDHGAPGLIAFPNSELLASDLLKTLNAMKSKRRFKRLLFYLEACESGSMFDVKLPNNIDIFALTAANPQESSSACYFDPQREAFLGDVFSVEWMEDSDKYSTLDSESIEKQYKKVKKLTNTSHVMEYGDISISKLPLGQFQGEKPSSSDDQPRRIPPYLDAVPSHDVPLILAQRKAKAATDPFEKANYLSIYQGMVNARNFMKSAMQSLSQKLQSHIQSLANEDLFRNKKRLTQTECYETLYKTFDEHCFDLSTHPHSLRYLYVLVNTCESMTNQSKSAITEVSDFIRDHCVDFSLKDTIFRSIH